MLSLWVSLLRNESITSYQVGEGKGTTFLEPEVLRKISGEIFFLSLLEWDPEKSGTRVGCTWWLISNDIHCTSLLDPGFSSLRNKKGYLEQEEEPW